MQRPTSVLVLAIINLCWAGLGVLMTCFGTLASIPVVTGSGGQPAMVELWRDSLAFRINMIVGTPVGLAVLAAEIIGAIGMLQGKAWGRTLTLAWAVCSLVLALVNTVFQVVVMTPAMLRNMPPTPNVPPQMASMIKAFAYVVAGCGIVLAVGYAILVLVLLNRDIVVAYFRVETNAQTPANM